MACIYPRGLTQGLRTREVISDELSLSTAVVEYPIAHVRWPATLTNVYFIVTENVTVTNGAITIGYAKSGGNRTTKDTDGFVQSQGGVIKIGQAVGSIISGTIRTHTSSVAGPKILAGDLITASTNGFSTAGKIKVVLCYDYTDEGATYEPVSGSTSTSTTTSTTTSTSA